MKHNYNKTQHCTTHTVHNGYGPQSKRCISFLNTTSFFFFFSHVFVCFSLPSVRTISLIRFFWGRSSHLFLCGSSCYMMLLLGRHLCECIHDLLPLLLEWMNEWTSQKNTSKPIFKQRFYFFDVFAAVYSWIR